MECRTTCQRRRLWVYQNQFGECHHLLQDQLLDDGRFQRYFHLSRTQFEDLLSHAGDSQPLGHQLQVLDLCCRTPAHLSSVPKTLLMYGVSNVRVEGQCAKAPALITLCPTGNHTSPLPTEASDPPEIPKDTQGSPQRTAAPLAGAIKQGEPTASSPGPRDPPPS
ncbi:hypothetical protein CRENBAI_005522 [Crenichthys baileyi]|uniref:Uncharacterized protein n=1 Tax=Crenichthys baileyi TaxID=28760 RepID=A0AAV9RUW7_9TELE